MQIPADSLIPNSKLVDYLLVSRDEDDKSAFLAFAGFVRTDAAALFVALRQHSQSAQAILQRRTPYGDVYTLDGELQGPNGKVLSITSVWIERLDGVVTFVTLFPRRSRP